MKKLFFIILTFSFFTLSANVLAATMSNICEDEAEAYWQAHGCVDVNWQPYDISQDTISFKITLVEGTGFLFGYYDLPEIRQNGVLIGTWCNNCYNLTIPGVPSEGSLRVAQQYFDDDGFNGVKFYINEPFTIYYAGRSVTINDTTIPPGPCAAEAIYGENSEQTELLRKYRDNVLSKTPEGQEIIKS